MDSILLTEDRILEMWKEVPASNAMLVGISGIDASGKGFTSKLLFDGLKQHGLRVALINIDGWLNLPHVRFDRRNPVENFYLNALRLDEMFERLILPLRERRFISLEADLAEETADEFHRYRYHFDNIDIILLEGIFLFKREYVEHFDLKIWIECSFETSLRRAIHRSQEGLSEHDTVKAYQEIYFPAQELHFAIDRPREAADLIFENN
jgi:uridine kinase